MAKEVITSQPGKDPDPARCVGERVILRTKDVPQAIRVAKLWFEGGVQRATWISV